jgi:energy-coupling factor transporter ATP-binding protein EcfA2
MNVDVAGVTRRFGRTQAVAGVDLEAGPGVLGLLGPNGAGKTSLLRMLATVIPPSSGRLRLLDRDPRGYGPRRQIPLTIEAGAAAVIGVATGSPFGEPERAAGRWLPWLRLAGCVALTGTAGGALAAAVAAAHLDGGAAGLVRDLAGLVGIALLTGAAAGSALAWIGPMAYVAVTLPALTEKWTTPWTWPARPTTAARRSAPPWPSPPGSRSSRCAGPVTGPASSRIRSPPIPPCRLPRGRTPSRG